jgi:predicted aconitase with swiveling domain
VMTSGRGSSPSSSLLAELIHAGTSPATIMTSTPSAILVLGALVPTLLYGERRSRSPCYHRRPRPTRHRGAHARRHPARR